MVLHNKMCVFSSKTNMQKKKKILLNRGNAELAQNPGVKKRYTLKEGHGGTKESCPRSTSKAESWHFCKEIKAG